MVAVSLALPVLLEGTLLPPAALVLMSAPIVALARTHPPVALAPALAVRLESTLNLTAAQAWTTAPIVMLGNTLQRPWAAQPPASIVTRDGRLPSAAQLRTTASYATPESMPKLARRPALGAVKVLRTQMPTQQRHAIHVGRALTRRTLPMSRFSGTQHNASFATLEL